MSNLKSISNLLFSSNFTNDNFNMNPCLTLKKLSLCKGKSELPLKEVNDV